MAALAKSVDVVVENGAKFSYPGGPLHPSLSVIFRPNGNVVFCNDNRGDLSKAPDFTNIHHLGPYQATIKDSDGATLLDAAIPGHWYLSRWTYRDKPIVAINTPADLVARNRMFPMGDIGATIWPVVTSIFTGPMATAGIVIYMPTTGERPDVGLVTDPSAFYMLTGKAGPMIAWAQAGGTCPMHFRDEKTGRPIDLLKYPKANCYSEPKQGTPWLARGEPDVRAPAFLAFGGGWEPQQAHYCEMSYLAQQATDDTEFLEDLQYSANFTVLCDGWMSGQTGKATVFGEYRGIAWAFRNLFMAHAATQDAEAKGTLPNTCHPSTYWKALLDQQLAFYTKFMKDPANQYFRLINGDDRFGPWQCDYMLMALAFGVLTGHDDWAPLYVWALKNAIDRTSGMSGYPPGYGGAYYMNVRPFLWATVTDPVTGTVTKKITNQIDTAAALFDWAASALYCMSVDPNGSPLTQVQIDALMGPNGDPLNGGRAMVGDGYLYNTRAVIFMAEYLEQKGLAKVRAAYGAALDKSLANVDRMVRNSGRVNARASFTLAIGATPVPIDNAPPPAQPGPGPSPTPVPAPTLPPPVEVHFEAVPPPPAGFRPKASTPDDIFDTSPTVSAFKVEDSKSRNVIGDGTTVVTWLWKDSDRPYSENVVYVGPTADGGHTWEERHASGQRISLYGCAGLMVGGKAVAMPPAFQFPQPAPQPAPQPLPQPTPAPAPQPQPEPQPPAPNPKPLARVAVSSITSTVAKKAGKGPPIIVKVGKVETCALVPLKSLPEGWK